MRGGHIDGFMTLREQIEVQKVHADGLRRVALLLRGGGGRECLLAWGTEKAPLPCEKRTIWGRSNGRYVHVQFIRTSSMQAQDGTTGRIPPPLTTPLPGDTRDGASF